MNPQLDLFTRELPNRVVPSLPVSGELSRATGGDAMKTKREETSREEAPSSGLSDPCLTTTHGILYQADCLDLLAAIRSESIDTIFADPPFNLQKGYKNGFQDQWRDADYLEWAFRWIDHCCRVLVP